MVELGDPGGEVHHSDGEDKRGEDLEGERDAPGDDFLAGAAAGGDVIVGIKGAVGAAVGSGAVGIAVNPA